MTESEPADRSDKFTVQPGGMVASQCLYCDKRSRGDFGLACRAFPSGVPIEIARNDADHRQPFEGDDGIRFAPRGDVPAQMLELLYRQLDHTHRV